MFEPPIPPWLDEPRTVTLWFTSPRRACVAAIRLATLIHDADFRLPATAGEGAEGSSTMIIGTIPATEVEHTQRLLDVLAVPVVWDQRPLSSARHH